MNTTRSESRNRQNTIAVTDGIKNLIPVFQGEMPPSVHMNGISS